MSGRERGKKLDDDDDDEVVVDTNNENKEENGKEVAKDEKPVKEVLGNTSTFQFDLKPVAIGTEPLKKIMTKGVPAFFLKLILSDEYIVFNSEISKISKRLYEYPIGEVSIYEDRMQIVSCLQVQDINKFKVRTIAIFLIDEDLLSQENYREILLAFHSQEQILDLKGNNLVHLTMNINL